MKYSSDKSRIIKITTYNSEEGIPVYNDHHYKLVSIYNNTTDEPIDAMAIMYLYVHDLSFGKK